MKTSGGQPCPLLQSDGDEVFGLVPILEVQRLSVVGLDIHLTVLKPGKFAKQRPGGLVVGGDRRLDALDTPAGRAPQDGLQHQSTKTAATGLL